MALDIGALESGGFDIGSQEFDPPPDITLAPGAASLTFTPGTPVVSFSGTINLTPGAATLTFIGAAASINAITLNPGPATLTFTGGTPVVTRTLFLAPAPAQLVFTGGTPGVSTVLTTASGTALYIDGVSYGTWKVDSFKIDKNLGATYTASVSLRYRGGTKPAVKMEVAMFWEGVKRFGGIIQSVSESAIPGDPLESLLNLKMTGYGSYLDRTVVAKLYTIWIGGVVCIILFDLWLEHLASLGVSHVYGNNPPVGIPDILFHYRTLREACNTLLDQAPGWSIWIDDNKELKLANTSAGGGGSAPFVLNRASLDVTKSADSIALTTSDSLFRNREWVIPSSDLASTRTDSATGDGSTLAFVTVYALGVKPIVEVDGVEVAVDTYPIWTGANCYYIQDGVGVFFHSAPGAVSVDITYPSPFQLAYKAEDAASIAAVGLYEHVTQGKDVVDKTTAEAMAQALLDLYGPGGVSPQSLQYSYNSAQQSGWLEPGMLQTVNWTFPDIAANFVVEHVSSEEQGLGLWRHSVTLRAGPGDVTGLSDLRALMTAIRDNNVNIPHVATMELNVDTDFATGVQPNYIRLKGNGVIASWDARDPENPGGSAWLIDLLLDGVSIFPSGSSNKINIADGDTSEQGGFRFLSDNLPYLDGQLLTMNVITAGPTSPRRNVVVHLNLKPTLAAGE
jgi:hypothetical protein